MYGILVAPNTIVAVRDRCVGGGDNAELGTRRVSMGPTRRRSVFCWSEEESEWRFRRRNAATLRNQSWPPRVRYVTRDTELVAPA